MEDKIEGIKKLIQEWEGEVPACFASEQFEEELLRVIRPKIKLVEALNRMDSIVCESSDLTPEEARQQAKDYNLLFNYINEPHKGDIA